MNRTPLPDWKSAGSFITYRRHQIYTRADGNPSAPVLLLIHGFPTASWDWEAIWPELISRYRVLTLDMIGFGFSAKPTDYNYSLIDQADLCEHLLLIQKLPLSRISSLLALLSSRRQFASSMQRIFGKQTQPDAELIDNFWQLIKENKGQRVLPKLLGYMPERKIHRERWVGALQHASVPTKVIDGMADPISGAHLVARYKELVPNHNVTELHDIGHYPQVEAPQAVLKAYLEFRDGLT